MTYPGSQLKTGVVKKNVNPVWGYQFQAEVEQISTFKVHFEVWDKGKRRGKDGEGGRRGVAYSNGKDRQDKQEIHGRDGVDDSVGYDQHGTKDTSTGPHCTGQTC